MHRLVAGIAFASMISFNSVAAPLDPGFKIEGRSAGEWSAGWWQWAVSSPDNINPVRDSVGTHCGVGQQGKVWFLAGGYGSSKIRRTCAVPAGKYLFFPVINNAFWPDEEDNGYTCEQAKESAAVNNDTALDLYVELNGTKIKDVKKYRVRTEKCFDIFARVPKEVEAYRAYPAASDGYWLLLEPLPKGKHTLKFGGRYNNAEGAGGGMVQDIEYQITVQ